MEKLRDFQHKVTGISSEMKVEHQWKACLTNTATQATAGFLGGVLVAVVVFPSTYCCCYMLLLLVYASVCGKGGVCLCI